METVRPLRTLPVANTLGEGILWDDLEQVFLWTDIHDRKLYRYHPGNDRLDRWYTPERLCSFGLVAGDPGALICAFESGFAMYRYEDGELEWLARPEAGVTGTRFNDGRVDRQGRFWSGTMIEGEAAFDARGEPVTASLYRLERGVCERMESGIRITNSLCWSLDSRRQYLGDSPAECIYAYDFEADGGSIGNRRVFARTDPPAKPDGSCIDAEDQVWNAQWGGREVVRYRPDGSIAMRLSMPVSQPTCVCFGGPELSWLAVTSATVELTDQQRAEQPLAGAVFLFETDYRGVPETRYGR
jgi:sugar lactone lactonase YvrE